MYSVQTEASCCVAVCPEEIVNAKRPSNKQRAVTGSKFVSNYFHH